MIIFIKCFGIKFTEQIVNPIIIIVFSVNFMVWKIKVNRIEKLRSDGCGN